MPTGNPPMNAATDNQPWLRSVEATSADSSRNRPVSDERLTTEYRVIASASEPIAWRPTTGPRTGRAPSTATAANVDMVIWAVLKATLVRDRRRRRFASRAPPPTASRAPDGDSSSRVADTAASISVKAPSSRCEKRNRSSVISATATSAPRTTIWPRSVVSPTAPTAMGARTAMVAANQTAT